MYVATPNFGNIEKKPIELHNVQSTRMVKQREGTIDVFLYS